MAKRRPSYLVRERIRHGKIIWYVLIGHEQRIRIYGTYGTQSLLTIIHLLLKTRKDAQNGSLKTIRRTRLTEGSFD
ncbi:MAG: hypothetical protein PV354_07995 [Bartonella sp.]|nr:hypothetical protein [Bartonella sp.]MDD9333592.1 hypothetical protein [Bartonella sp.]